MKRLCPTIRPRPASAMSLSDFSSASPESSGTSTAPSPSVSRAQWASFALRKLREGYVLLQAPNGKVYQFYRAGEPLQPCPAHAARKLLAAGLLGVARSDIRGTHYTLLAPFQPEPGAEA